MPTDPKRYTEYYAFNTEGGRIALLSCLRCGAVVMIGDPTSGPEIHDAWHEEQERD